MDLPIAFTGEIAEAQKTLAFFSYAPGKVNVLNYFLFHWLLSLVTKEFSN